MSKITIDAELYRRLGNLSEMLEICDENGHLMAQVIPFVNSAELDLEPKITKEELARRKNSSERTYTTAEVLAHLESLK
jgi:hypothetical protein